MPGLKKKELIRKMCVEMLLGCLMIFSLGVVSVYAAYEDGVLPELKLEASATLDAYNKYLWRGFTLDTDPVVQPGVFLSGYGVTLSYWSSFDTDSNDALSSDEVDFIIDYTYEFEYVNFSLGHTNYNFPAADTYSKELYVGFSLSKVILTPKVTFYRDYGKEANGGGDGQYVNLGVSYSTQLLSEPEISLDLGASVGFNHELFIKGNGGDFLITAGLTIPLTKNATLSPKLGYAAPFGDLKDANDGNQKNRTYGGVSLGFIF